MRQSEPPAKVAYDPRLHIVRRALGTHIAASRLQGGRPEAKRDIRIAGRFRQAPAALKMIVVHELAHLRERQHGKTFHAHCTHMEPDDPQLEFDLRLWLTAVECQASAGQEAHPR